MYPVKSLLFTEFFQPNKNGIWKKNLDMGGRWFTARGRRHRSERIRKMGFWFRLKPGRLLSCLCYSFYTWETKDCGCPYGKNFVHLWKYFVKLMGTIVPFENYSLEIGHSWIIIWPFISSMRFVSSTEGLMPAMCEWQLKCALW